jgi:hypothetical protein
MLTATFETGLNWSCSFFNLPQASFSQVIGMFYQLKTQQI